MTDKETETPVALWQWRNRLGPDDGWIMFSTTDPGVMPEQYEKRALCHLTPDELDVFIALREGRARVVMIGAVIPGYDRVQPQYEPEAVEARHVAGRANASELASKMGRFMYYENDQPVFEAPEEASEKKKSPHDERGWQPD